MSRVTDFVCELVIDAETAPEKSMFRGQSFYFCSMDCRRLFQSDPWTYVGPAQTRAAVPLGTGIEQLGPPSTASVKKAAPKVGSAGNGGAEYEKLPEAHEESPTDTEACRYG